MGLKPLTIVQDFVSDFLVLLSSPDNLNYQLVQVSHSLFRCMVLISFDDSPGFSFGLLRKLGSGQGG